ncbi:MAG: SpoIIE family protein phosphatase [Oscillospiraceae bacterium]|nr:SpoIIE family protein phosphatase [Oscillospiraceae bacterium]
MQVASKVKKRRRQKAEVFAASKEFITQLCFFLGGAVIAGGAQFGQLRPFGAAFAAAAPFRYLFSASAGAVMGYIISDPGNSFRYITILIAMAAIRWLFNDIKRISNSGFFIPVAVFLPVAATGVALLFSSGSELTDLGFCLTEAFAAAGAAYFFVQTIDLFLSNRTLTSFNQQEIASIVFAGCIALLSLNIFALGGVALGRIAAGVFVLLCARYGGVGVGSICGIATGVVFSLNSADMLFLCGAYAFGGVIAGVFAHLGKLASAGAFALCCAVMSVMSGENYLMVATLIETAVACTVFMLLPKSLGNVLSAVFLDKQDATRGESFKNAVVTRLGYASEALENVSDCVNNVSDKLERMYTPSADWVFDETKERVCKTCGLRVYCWEKEKESTVQDFAKLKTQLEQHGDMDLTVVEKCFEKTCCKQKEIANSMNETYREYLAYKDAKRRVTQIRSVVAGQFAGLSDILKDMAAEFEAYCKFDNGSSEKITEYLKNLDFAVLGCSCMVNNQNRMTVEIEIANNHKGNLKKPRFAYDISKLCGRQFVTPNVSYAGDKIRILMSEEPVLSAEIGTCQYTAYGGGLCGDSFTYFEDGAGNLVTIISDGMGTGGKAAVDGNMAASIMKKLIKSGLSYDSALQIVNSSLIVKSDDETSATLDVGVIDMFTGQMKMLKAGAPATYIRKNGKVLKKELPALPVGILYDVKFSKDEIELNEDDIVVMVSDGVLEQDEQWLINLLKSWKAEKPDALAQRIVEEAKQRSGEHEDDITAVAVRVR